MPELDTPPRDNIRDHLEVEDKAALANLMKSLRTFESESLRCLQDGTEFTVKLELRGAKGKIDHTRTVTDEIRKN